MLMLFAVSAALFATAIWMLHHAVRVEDWYLSLAAGAIISTGCWILIATLLTWPVG